MDPEFEFVCQAAVSKVRNRKDDHIYRSVYAFRFEVGSLLIAVCAV